MIRLSDAGWRSPLLWLLVAGAEVLLRRRLRVLLRTLGCNGRRDELLSGIRLQGVGEELGVRFRLNRCATATTNHDHAGHDCRRDNHGSDHRKADSDEQVRTVVVRRRLAELHGVRL